MELRCESEVTAGAYFFARMAIFVDRHDLLKHISSLKIHEKIHPRLPIYGAFAVRFTQGPTLI
jgi:hypothetical protein